MMSSCPTTSAEPPVCHFMSSEAPLIQLLVSADFTLSLGSSGIILSLYRHYIAAQINLNTHSRAFCEVLMLVNSQIRQLAAGREHIVIANITQSAG